MVFVVEFHYAAGNGGFEGGVVICRGIKDFSMPTVMLSMGGM